MNLKNKIALVTGGVDGLGLSITKALLSEGVIVHAVSRNEKTQNEVMKSLNDKNLYVHKADVSSFPQIETIVKDIGQIDILINNAGIWLEGDLLSYSEKQISDTIDTNTKGLIYTTKAVLARMKTKDSGCILNISSTLGLIPREAQTVYVASKYAVTGFTESLKLELAKSNIQVIGVYPGGMNTKFFAKASSPKDNEKWMNTNEVAKTIVFILKTDDSLNIDHIVLKKKKVI